MNGISMAGVLAAGTALGLFFYGGLWFTVWRLPSARYPALLIFASFWARTAAVAGGVVLLARHHWQYALIVMLGFVLGRLAISWFLRERRPLAKCT